MPTAPTVSETLAHHLVVLVLDERALVLLRDERKAIFVGVRFVDTLAVAIAADETAATRGVRWHLDVADRLGMSRRGPATTLTGCVRNTVGSQFRLAVCRRGEKTEERKDVEGSDHGNYQQLTAEEVRFELTGPFDPAVFKTASIDHSLTLPDYSSSSQ